MNDTPKHIFKLQHQIIFSKPREERIRMGFEMIAEGWQIMENSIKQKNPNLTRGELVAAMFKRCYALDFDKVTLEKIAQSIIDFHHKNNKNKLES